MEGDGLRHDVVFGYGSLVAGRGRRARLDGYRRVWGVAMDNTVDLPGYKRYLAPDGSRPALCVAFLDVVPDAPASVDGVCVPVDGDALARLDDRERNYERIDVTGRVDVDTRERVWAYVGRADSRARFAAAVAEGRCAIASDYLAAVEAGVRAVLGDGAWDAPTDGLPVLDLRRVDLPY